MERNLVVHIIDSVGQVNSIRFYKWEYHSLQAMISDRLYEDTGDCKGKGICGTCHVKAMSKSTVLGEEENRTLSKTVGVTDCSRLACQVELDESIDERYYKIELN